MEGNHTVISQGTGVKRLENQVNVITIDKLNNKTASFLATLIYIIRGKLHLSKRRGYKSLCSYSSFGNLRTFESDLQPTEYFQSILTVLIQATQQSVYRPQAPATAISS